MKEQKLLEDGHELKSLSDGARRFAGLCNGKDLIWVNFEGLDIAASENAEAGLSYYGGTGGSWNFLYIQSGDSSFRKVFDSEDQGRFRNLISVSPEKRNPKEIKCPDLTVELHGSYCKKAGFETCPGTLKFKAGQYSIEKSVLK